MEMIGTLCGAKNNKLTGFFRNIDSHKDAKSTTSEDGVSYVTQADFTSKRVFLNKITSFCLVMLMTAPTTHNSHGLLDEKRGQATEKH